jgi:hypothetical protein
VVLALRGRWALMLRTGWVVVRRMVRMSSSPRSMVMVCWATWTVTTRPAWIRPSAIFCPAIMMMPVLLARRWVVMGSAEGRGGGPGGPRAGGHQPGQAGGGQVGADRLDPQPARGQVDHVGVGPESDDLPGAAGSEARPAHAGPARADIPLIPAHHQQRDMPGRQQTPRRAGHGHGSLIRSR